MGGGFKTPSHQGHCMEHLDRELHGGFPYSPVAKLSEPMTHKAALSVSSPFIVIKMQELLKPSWEGFSRRFDAIRSAGGVHSYFHYSGNVLLSLIMPNRMIRGCTLRRYSEAIDAVKPDFTTTIDGETYSERLPVAEKECERCIYESEELMRMQPDHTFFGLVKGATLEQIQKSTDAMMKLGCRTLIFHAGDFVQRGSATQKMTAITFARHIRARAPSFVLYGVSDPYYLHRFPTADAYVTQSHFIQAFYGKRLEGERWMDIGRQTTEDDITWNLVQMKRLAVNSTAPNRGLMRWVEETSAPHPLMQAVDMNSTAPQRRLATSL